MKKWNQIGSLTAILLLLPAATFASIVMPGDGPYYSLRKPRILYVYDKTARDSVDQLAAYMETVHAGYELSYGWKLDETQDLVLMSPMQQVANAYAMTSPNIKSAWYPSGAAIMEYMAESSWGLGLATHETAHLYQLNAKGDVPAFLKKIVGNAFVITPFWPIFISPNNLTPTFLVEGNATMNESRFNDGGRLHSGEARTLVFSQIQAGEINPNRLINNQFRYPYNETAYLQGAYFQAHLATKYGIDKTNQFFLAQGNHYLWPLILNKTFRDHFGASYPQEIREYVREMEAMAKNQVHAPESPLEASPFAGALNHDRDRIFYVRSDGVSLPYLDVFDKRTGKITSERMQLDLGKVFWLEGEPYVAASDQHSLHRVEYGLYGEGRRLHPKYRSQIVNDMRAGKVLALDPANSWLEPRVLVDGEFFDVGHSQPISDEAGNVYYFRQNGAERVLYKNRQPVFKYSGFYGKVMEIGEDGAIYFIGNSDYGSTLYRYINGEIVRMLASDRVVDARKVNDSEFFIVENTSTGHEFKVSKATPRSTQPVLYSYGFPSQSLIPQKLQDSEQSRADERTYNAWREMRYSYMDFMSSYGSTEGFGVGVGMNFNDPLQYQSVNAFYSGTQFRDENVFLQYGFTKYLPKLYVSYWYNKDIWREIGSRLRTSFNQRVDLTLAVPLLRWRNWDARVSFSPSFLRSDDHSGELFTGEDPEMEETYSLYSRADVTYQVDSTPAINMYPLRSFQLSYLNKLETLANKWEKENNSSVVQSLYAHSFPWQIYGNFAGAVAWSETHDIDVVYNPYAFNDTIAVSRLTPHNEYTVKTASLARLEVAKVFDLKVYSPRIPVGLDRLAPVVVAQGLFFDDDVRVRDEYPANIFEWGVGVDLQVLIAHLGSAKIRYLIGYDTRYPQQPSEELRFTSKWNF